MSGNPLSEEREQTNLCFFFFGAGVIQDGDMIDILCQLWLDGENPGSTFLHASEMESLVLEKVLSGEEGLGGPYLNTLGATQ